MIGWIGSLAFGLCGLPQAWRVYRDGHANGLDFSFLVLWTIGDLFSLIAVLQDSPVPYLIANYVCTAVFLTVLWKYKIWPREREEVFK